MRICTVCEDWANSNVILPTLRERMVRISEWMRDGFAGAKGPYLKDVPQKYAS